jgi:hypothetical protein
MFGIHRKFPEKFFVYHRMSTSLDELSNLIYDRTENRHKYEEVNWSCGKTGCNINVNTNIVHNIIKLMFLYLS